MPESPRSSEQTVRALFAAFAARDVEAALVLLDPAVELWPQATAALVQRAEPYRGHDGFRRYMADVARVWEHFAVDPSDFRVAGDAVICFGDARGRARGEAVARNLPVIWVFRLSGERIAYLRVARTAAEATELAAATRS